MISNCVICNSEFDKTRNVICCSDECNIKNRKIKLHLNYQKTKTTNKAKRLKNLKSFLLKNPEYKKKYMREYRKTTQNKEYNRKYKSTSNYKKKRLDRDKKRYANDVEFRLATRLRSTLLKCFKRGSQKSRSLVYLGCSIEEWKIHLESKFDNKTSWENYGKYWDIDHIKPLSSFDFSNELELKKAFNYKNTQPLEKTINRHVKRNRLDWKQ